MVAYTVAYTVTYMDPCIAPSEVAVFPPPGATCCPPPYICGCCCTYAGDAMVLSTRTQGCASPSCCDTYVLRARDSGSGALLNRASVELHRVERFREMI